MSVRRLKLEPLNAVDFAPYGQVLMAFRDGPSMPWKPANFGTAKRFNQISSLQNLRAQASLNIALFRCEANHRAQLSISLLEKHPFSSQLFVPMHASTYVIVAALGDVSPDLSTLRSFLANHKQAMTYHPGVWHQPLIALEQESDFVCFVYEDGSPDDCVEHSYETPVGLIELPDSIR